MKNALICILLFCSAVMGQVNSKGVIRFTYNTEKVEVPVTSVSINKQDELRISFRGEKNDEKAIQMFSMELGFTPDWGNKVDYTNPQLLGAQMMLVDYKTDLARTISIRGNGKEFQSMFEKTKAKERNWKYYGMSTTSKNMAVTLEKFSVKDDRIVIKGRFLFKILDVKIVKKDSSGKEIETEGGDEYLELGDDELNNKVIKEGYFEIIL